MNMFTKITIPRVRRNKFNLSHERKMSLKFGKLYPILVTEVVPGDVFRLRSEVMMRFAPLLAPVMHRVNVWTHYYFVPERLVHNEFEPFITGGEDGEEAPVVPFINLSNYINASGPASNLQIGSLWDYMGLPVAPDPVSWNHDPIMQVKPFRAYQLIYNEYYRDQNLEDPVEVNLTSGEITQSEALSLLTLRTRAWEKDYFTSCLPWPQRGPAAGLPINITYKDASTVLTNVGGQPAAGNIEMTQTGGEPVFGDSGLTPLRVENIDETGLQFTINDLRTSMKLQEWLEAQARGGARYIETILHQFGVESSDARLQRPEYLGGGMQPVTISEVLQTSGTIGSEDTPQGTMAGHGLSIGAQNGFKRSFEEHGYVIGIMSVLPRTAYQQGLPKMWTRFDKFDYYWTKFAHLGEQDVLNQELYYDWDDDTDQRIATFGYQSRYAEYKYIPSTVHGDFKESLDFWHMGRIFGSQPSLNVSFVQADPTDRIFAVQDGSDYLWCQIFHKFDALRPMPYFGTPRL